MFVILLPSALSGCAGFTVLLLFEKEKCLLLYTGHFKLCMHLNFLPDLIFSKGHVLGWVIYILKISK